MMIRNTKRPKSKANRRKTARQPRLPKLNNILRLGLIAVIILGLLAITLWLYRHPAFTLDRIAVNQSLDESQLKQVSGTLLPAMGRSLLVLPTQKLQSQLTELPWVKTVTVRRIGPHEIGLEFKKQQPTAYWAGHGYLNENGQPFLAQEPNETKQKLPWIYAKPAKISTAFQRFRIAEQLLASYQLKLDEMALKRPNLWQIKLRNDLVITLEEKRFKGELERFLPAYTQLFEDKKPGQYYVDLRYPHGFVLGRQ